VVSFTQGNLDSNLSITACQEVGGGGQNDLDILSGNPNGSTYQWQVSYDNGLSWENASGPTNIQNQYVLDPFYTLFTSNSGTYKFRLLIDNNGCSGVSNLLTLTVSGTSALTAGTIVGNQSSCGQSLDPAGFTSSAAAGGMSPPNYTYQWQSSIDGVNFTNIANNATSTTYNSPAINQTTYFRRSVRSGGCSAFSNVLSVLVGAPVANVSQPSCTSSTGTVTVPFPASGITYAITGTSPVVATVTNTTGIFSGLTPGDYEVRFIAAAACVSLPTSVTVNEQPLVPTMPVTKTAQPCGVPTGTITVTPQNAGETYSFDNGTTFQSSNIKSGLTPGNYYVIIKNLVCNSQSKLTVINTSPTTPSTPVIASVIHPICAVSTGTITVTVQNTGEFYSFDNGVTFQSSNIKSGLTAGSYNVIIQSAGGCNSILKQVTINVQPLVPLAPSVTETVPTCALQTGTITITQVGTETYSFDGGAFSSNLTYSGLAQGSLHTVRAMNAGGCISPTVNISITSLTNKWTAGAWSLGTPTAEQKLVFDDDYSENIDIVGCSCQVNAKPLAPFEVTITTGHTMTITNEVSVDVDGFLTFEDDASLVQINNATNTGEIDYIRTTDTGIYKTDYVYWSSPVEGFTLGGVSKNLTLSDKYYSYEPTATGEDWQQESTLTEMASGKGYIIRGPEYGPSAQPGNKYTATFTGVPNNGHYEINDLFADKSYLLGNPYPSALDADTFMADNAAVLNGTLYFWTHNTDMQNRNLILSTAGSGAFAYTSNDYATYNATGGVGIDSGTVTAPAPVGTNPRGDNNANPPSGKIASGQGFFASSKLTIPANTKIIFDNTMRVGVIDITKEDNSQFFKTRNPNGKTANTKVIEKNRVWLNLTNAKGAFKQTLVGYLTDATNDYDDRFDGESFDGNEFIDFYSLNQEINLTIQGRALPFDENDEVPLGYKTTINGAFTINIAQVDGLLTNQAVFIEDKLTNTVFDLKTGNYPFNTAAGTFNERFVLKYTNKILSVDQTDKVDGILAFYSNNYKTLIIKNNLADATVNSVALFNLLGQKIENWDVSDSEQTNLQIPIKNISSGIYIVKVKTTKGESSKKIIVN
jgi:Fe-S cluster assembly iron-binding protein IscA